VGASQPTPLPQRQRSARGGCIGHGIYVSLRMAGQALLGLVRRGEIFIVGDFARRACFEQTSSRPARAEFSRSIQKVCSHRRDVWTALVRLQVSVAPWAEQEGNPSNGRRMAKPPRTDRLGCSSVARGARHLRVRSRARTPSTLFLTRPGRKAGCDSSPFLDFHHRSTAAYFCVCPRPTLTRAAPDKVSYPMSDGPSNQSPSRWSRAGDDSAPSILVPSIDREPSRRS